MDKHILINLIEHGDADAFLAYGIVSATQNRADSLAEIIAWCESAGNHGISFGYLAAALLLQEYFPEQREKALVLLRKSAEKSNLEAMYQLAQSIQTYSNGDASVVEAIYWYRKAALHSHASAAYRLVELIEDGRATSEETTPYTAFEWCELAGKLGHSHAAFRLGEAYDEGISTPKDEQLSRHWFEVSAILGNSMAHRLLAVSYTFGQSSFPIDPILAKFHEQRAEEIARLESINRMKRHQEIEGP